MDMTTMEKAALLGKWGSKYGLSVLPKILGWAGGLGLGLQAFGLLGDAFGAGKAALGIQTPEERIAGRALMQQKAEREATTQYRREVEAKEAQARQYAEIEKAYAAQANRAAMANAGQMESTGIASQGLLGSADILAQARRPFSLAETMGIHA